MSNYVCRDHLEPVTWRGTGCPQCAITPREPKRRKHAPREINNQLHHLVRDHGGPTR